jgi:hypothetical protein
MKMIYFTSSVEQSDEIILNIDVHSFLSPGFLSRLWDLRGFPQYLRANEDIAPKVCSRLTTSAFFWFVIHKPFWHSMLYNLNNWKSLWINIRLNIKSSDPKIGTATYSSNSKRSTLLNVATCSLNIVRNGTRGCVSSWKQRFRDFGLQH